MTLKPYQWLIIIIAVFTVLLFLGVHQIYHQDEYSWIRVVMGINGAKSPHPPMFEGLLRAYSGIFGFNNLRFIPLFFAAWNALLIYFISKKLTGKSIIGLLAASLFVFNTYSLIAGLQLDIDGALLPFFVLLAYLAHIHFPERKNKWFIVFGLAVLGGLLTKLSFVLFIGALLVDYLIKLYEKYGGKKVLYQLLRYSLILLFIFAGLYYFLLSRSAQVVAYATHFKSLNFGSRAYFDLGFKLLKSFVWLSPLLLLGAVFGFSVPELRKRYRFWFLYLLFNVFFYTVPFDFTTLTIERYFMFLIAPCAIIGGDVLYLLLQNLRGFKRKDMVMMFFIFTVLSFVILNSYHVTIPLNPKTAYVEHLKSFNLNFLIPFTGGSGPIGFYFSAQFIFWTWLVSAVSFLVYYFIPRKKVLAAAILVVIAVGYNSLFISEFLFGTINGSVPAIARETVDYVNNNPDIGQEQVITYYDIAPYDLRVSGKYYSRFYTAINRDYTPKVTNFRGYYMIVDFPEIGENHPYWKLIQRCPIIKEFQDKKIKSYIFDCTDLPDEKNEIN